MLKNWEDVLERLYVHFSRLRLGGSSQMREGSEGSALGDQGA